MFKILIVLSLLGITRGANVLTPSAPTFSASLSTTQVVFIADAAAGQDVTFTPTGDTDANTEYYLSHSAEPTRHVKLSTNEYDKMIAVSSAGYSPRLVGRSCAAAGALTWYLTATCTSSADCVTASVNVTASWSAPLSFPVPLIIDDSTPTTILEKADGRHEFTVDLTAFDSSKALRITAPLYFLTTFLEGSTDAMFCPTERNRRTSVDQIVVSPSAKWLYIVGSSYSANPGEISVTSFDVNAELTCLANYNRCMETESMSGCQAIGCRFCADRFNRASSLAPYCWYQPSTPCTYVEGGTTKTVDSNNLPCPAGGSSTASSTASSTGSSTSSSTGGSPTSSSSTPFPSTILTLTLAWSALLFGRLW